MPFLLNKPGYSAKIGLKSQKCIDTALRPLKDHVTIKINGSLTSEDIFCTAASMAVNRNSVHSVSTRYQDVASETSLRYHLKKLNMDKLIKSNEKILLKQVLKTLKTDKRYEFAADYANDPYYGETDPSNEKYVIGRQAKKSTNSLTCTFLFICLTRTKGSLYLFFLLKRTKQRSSTSHILLTSSES